MRKLLFTIVSCCGAAALLAGCQSTPGGELPPAVVVAPVTSESSLLAAQAADAVKARRYEEAGRLYSTLAKTHEDPKLRADYTYTGAECAFARADYYEAYQLYSELLKLYPSTRHFTKVVDRIFTVARLYAEGKASKPSWLLGAELSDREFGVDILTAFQKARERHPLADDALHHKALALFAMDEWEEAIATWQKLVEEYPTSDWAETAEYRIGLTMLGISDGAEYDKGPILAALSHLRAYVKKYPNGDHLDEANGKIAEIEEALAEHWLDIAQFYLRKDQDYSASVYLEAIDREYPNTEAAKEAKEIHSGIPKSSPPPPRKDPDGLEGPNPDSVDRYRKPPPVVGQPKPVD